MPPLIDLLQRSDEVLAHGIFFLFKTNANVRISAFVHFCKYLSLGSKDVSGKAKAQFNETKMKILLLYFTFLREDGSFKFLKLTIGNPGT